MSDLAIVTNKTGNVTVVGVSGRVDSQSAPKLDQALTPVAGENSAKVVIDLSGVEYMSSAGIRAIVKAAQNAEKNGGSVKLAAVPEAVHSVLYTVGLDQVVKVFDSVDEATASFN